MKITKQKLKQIVKEELQKALRESFETDSETLKTELKQAWAVRHANKTREFGTAAVLQFWGHMNDEDVLRLIQEAIEEYNVENPDDHVGRLDMNEVARTLNAMAQQREER